MHCSCHVTNTDMLVIKYLCYKKTVNKPTIVNIPSETKNYNLGRSVKQSIVRRDRITCSFITSPHAGAPTSPVPTFLAFLSKDPTFLGFS